MRLQKCEDSHGQKVTCLVCGTSAWLQHAYADLDGPSFRAYYHAECLPEGATK